MAGSIWSLEKPMLSMFAIASSRCGPPRASALGSLKFLASAPGAAGAGEGVAGAVDVVFGAGAGAAGAAGVDAGAGTGVEGVFEVDEEAAGAAFGFRNHQPHILDVTLRLKHYLRYHTDYEPLLLDAVRLHSIGIL